MMNEPTQLHTRCHSGIHRRLRLVHLLKLPSLVICYSAAMKSSFVNALTNPLSSKFHNEMILAPLTRGGNLPFRRLCADFGMNTSLSEMVYARPLLKGEGVEHARMRRAASEHTFGVQIATNTAKEGMEAIRLAKQAGADFVDLNCGCPIYDATRRGLGSALLRNPTKLATLVEQLVDATRAQADLEQIPVTVKVRLGLDSDNINVLEVVDKLREAGASAVTIHGRTALQGYRKAADWDLIGQVVKQNSPRGMLVVGNGDILSHIDAYQRMTESRVDAVMVGRGALIKPWIFQEYQQQQAWEPDPHERVAVYRRLTSYMKEHFGDDELGRRKAWNFLPWHFDFFCRYLDCSHENNGDGPLIQIRDQYLNDSNNTPPLDVLLANRNSQSHGKIASLLWDSTSDQDAIRKLTAFAESKEFKEIEKTAILEEKETEELSNIRPSDGKWHKRRGRKPKPKRTPEEIAIIRAERAAKKTARLAKENGITS